MKNFFRYSILYLIVSVTLIRSCPHEDKDTIISIENTENLKNLTLNNPSSGPCLIFLYMQGCSWCEKMKPIITKLALDDHYCEHITFYQGNGQNLDASNVIKNNINIQLQGYPTILFMKHGKLIDTQVGGAPINTIRQKLQNLLMQ